MSFAVGSLTAVVLLLLLTFGFFHEQDGMERVAGYHRRLLQHDEDRVGERCTKDDIVVHQGPTPPLPNGIPTYTVVVLNLCSASESDGCAMGNIHLSCGAFSSARLVNPRVFRRLRINDCLLNDGRPLPAGSSISFQYANSFSYPMAISYASCIIR